MESELVMTRVSAPSLFELGNDAPSRLRLSPHKSLMSSVIGNTFKILKANVSHDTAIDDWGVVLKYASNLGKSGRMEADIGVFQVEADAVAAAATAKALESALADANAVSALAAAMAKAKGPVRKGLGHGSMSAVIFV